MHTDTRIQKQKPDEGYDRRGTAFFVFLILFTIDIITILVSNRRAFLGGAVPLVHLIVAGVAMAFILSLFVSPIMRGCSRLTAHISTRFPNPMFGVFGNAALLAIAGVLIANSRSGQWFKPAPLWHDAAALLPGVAYFFCARFLFKRFGAPANFTGFSAVSFLTVGLALAAHAEEFLKGRFGFEGKGAVSALAVLGIVTVTVAFFHGIAALNGLSPNRRQHLLLAVLSIAVLCVLQALNSYFYVDLYYVFHGLLSLFSFVAAVQPARWLSERFSLRLQTLPRWTTAVLLLVSISIVVFVARPKSVTAYVAGIHTVHYRAVLEPFYRIGQTVEDVRESAFVLYRKVLKRKDVPFFISPAEKLPDGFRDFSLSDAPKRPSIDGLLFIVLDAKRPRDLGVYQESELKNPNLERYFSDAFVFENNISVGNRTKRSLPALYTGCHWQSVLYNTWMGHPSFWHSYQHGNGFGHSFKKAGFETISLSNDLYYKDFFTQKAMLPVFGGFDKIYNEAAKGTSDTDRLIRAFKQRTDDIIPPVGKFATVIQLYDHAAKFTDEMDEMIGLLCESLIAKNRWDRTVIAITADHGTQRREHGRTSYGRTLFSEEIRVPYLLRVPEMSGRRITAPVASIDHLPSLLDIFGIPADIKVEGESYLPLLNNTSQKPRSPIFVKSHSPSSAVIADNLKLIKWFTQGPYALFDLKKDPEELTSLVSDPAYQDAFTRLKRLLENFEADHPSY